MNKIQLINKKLNKIKFFKLAKNIKRTKYVDSINLHNDWSKHRSYKKQLKVSIYNKLITNTTDYNNTRRWSIFFFYLNFLDYLYDYINLFKWNFYIANTDIKFKNNWYFNNTNLSLIYKFTTLNDNRFVQPKNLLQTKVICNLIKFKVFFYYYYNLFAKLNIFNLIMYNNTKIYVLKKTNYFNYFKNVLNQVVQFKYNTNDFFTRQLVKKKSTLYETIKNMKRDITIKQVKNKKKKLLDLKNIWIEWSRRYKNYFKKSTMYTNNIFYDINNLISNKKLNFIDFIVKTFRRFYKIKKFKYYKSNQNFGNEAPKYLQFLDVERRWILYKFLNLYLYNLSKYKTFKKVNIKFLNYLYILKTINISKLKSNTEKISIFNKLKSTSSIIFNKNSKYLKYNYISARFQYLYKLTNGLVRYDQIINFFLVLSMKLFVGILKM